MWQRFRGEMANPGESHQETDPTTEEARVAGLQRENEQLRRQANYFARLIDAENHAMPEILHLSERLRGVVGEFNNLLLRANEQWECDERRLRDDPQPPMCAAAAYTNNIDHNDSNRTSA